MAAEIRMLRRGDEEMLLHTGDDVFDNPVDPHLAAQFLSRDDHHIIAAIENDTIVGFVSAVSYVHPDKEPELWINEAGVASTHQGQGIGKQLMNSMLALGKQMKCTEAWVLTNRSNPRAMKLYSSAGGVEDADDIVMYNFDLKTLSPVAAGL